MSSLLFIYMHYREKLLWLYRELIFLPMYFINKRRSIWNYLCLKGKTSSLSIERTLAKLGV